MDNDNKINSKAEVRLFLHEELLPLEKSRHAAASYNLINEYAKTKHNKSPFIWILLGSCVFVVGLITAGVTVYLSKQNNKIAVSSEQFTDLDMRSTLETRSHAEINTLITANEQQRLEKELEGKLKQAAFDRDSELYVIQQLRLEQGTEERRSAARKAYANRIAALHAEYDKKIQDARDAAAAEKATFDALPQINADADFAAQVQQHERKMLVTSYTDSISQLQKLGEQNRQADYTGRRSDVTELAVKYQKEVDGLDPVLSDTNADRILKSTADSSTFIRYDPEAFAASLPQDVLTEDFRAGMKSVQTLLSDYEYIHRSIAGIPQKHSMKSYKDSEHILVSRISAGISSAAKSQIDSLNSRRLQLEKDKAQLQAQKEVLENEKAALETQTADQQRQISELQAQITDLQSRLPKKKK